MSESLSLAALEAEIAVLEPVVAKAGLADEAALAPHRPGNAQNPETGARGALRYLCVLHRLHSRSERADVSRPVAEELVQAALGATPMPLRLPGEDIPPHLGVHPKSFAALQHMARIDQRIRRLLALKRVVEGANDPDDALTALEAALTELYLLLLWGATHPGPGVPWPWEATPWDGGGPAVPAWLRSVPVEAVLAASVLFASVNLQALRALDVLTLPVEREQSTSWATFFATTAPELREPVTTLLRERPLVTLITQSALIADQQRRLQQRAAVTDG